MSADTRDIVRAAIAQALERAQSDGVLPPVPAPEIQIERPQKREHGDYACNVALRLASSMRRPPLDVAQEIAARIQPTHDDATVIADVQVARPGFLNLRLNPDWTRAQLHAVIDAGPNWGRIDAGQGQRIQIEFVSANPTGPLQVGNGRGAVLGDALAAVLDAAGYHVQREYYVNDAGAQIRLFGQTLRARYLQHHGQDADIPEGGYPGQYMIDLAQHIADHDGERWLPDNADESNQALTRRGLNLMIDQIRADLALLGVQFDHWQSEQALYDGGSDSAYQIAMNKLRDAGCVVEKEGAVWFRSDAVGEDKDNVLIRSSGEPTYFASDVAYHYDKFIARAFDRVIDVWGADHQGHVSRTKAAVAAVGADPEQLEVLLYQLVHLKRGGERVRMGKRTGEMVTLRELVEEVGPDAARFFLLQRSADAQMDFDLDAALSQDPRQNPVSYVQYAHARCAGIRRAAAEQHLAPARDLSQLTDDREDALISAILRFPELVADMAQRREPHHLTTYAQDLAQHFTQFYDACRVIDPDAPERSGARLTLVEAAQTALAAVLAMIGVAAPDDM